MSTVNLTGPKSHSQLATNRFLMALVQIFGSEEFTSRDVTSKFGLDFLNTAKRLSRMSRKPYHLLSAWKVARDFGGVENVYAISPHGWSKVHYIQSQQPAPVNGPTRENSAAIPWYLLNGNGQESLFTAPLLKNLVGKTSSPLDETGQLLSHFDSQMFFSEHVLTQGIFSNDEHLKTASRCAHLQRLGLIPKEIDIPSFVLTAFYLGASASSIIIGLLIRGGIKLWNESMEFAIRSGISSGMLQLYRQQANLNTLTKCENCHSREMLIESLTSDLDNSRLDNLKLNNRISKLENHIVDNGRAIGLVGDSLEKFNDPSPSVDLVKAHIRFALAGIVLMNINAYSGTS